MPGISSDLPAVTIEKRGEMLYWVWTQDGLKIFAPFFSSSDESTEECLQRGEQWVRAYYETGGRP